MPKKKLKIEHSSEQFQIDKNDEKRRKNGSKFAYCNFPVMNIKLFTEFLSILNLNFRFAFSFCLFVHANSLCSN